ncbi:MULTISPECIES: SRPBCC domain-containing protein [unclassified Microbacterium]|uniref:SRPBCC family protein n=1 Tax=unclassified Microbacterium TaxID=2609290 RepID=UPI000EA915E0|nr:MULTISPECIES: SRPBCC domain-containing protein [unclassified Microbacterium]MBT2484401.1 SRPBCC domain-containing protein [Microbacterium sp. ISL-108]RKN67312.1 SRPBCC domain-containing protein [Microbacterium sp. CGR2]
MSERPKIQITVAAPASAVWEALRDRDRIRQWHGWEFDGGVDGSLDQEIDLIYFTDVKEDERGILLNGGDRVDVEPVDGGTRVTLTRAAPSGDADWDRYYDDITEGWITFIEQLGFAVERHPSGTRRTILLRGHVSVSPLDAMGVADLQPGDRFMAALPAATVTGRVRFRSEHQIGLVVDGWNDGLLVLSHVPESGVGMALLSLYDVKDDVITALSERWGEWWSSAIQHPHTPRSDG